MSLTVKFSDDKKIINFKNLFMECFRFNTRSMFPATVPIHYTLLYMLQSTDYILSPDFVSNYKKLDFGESEVLWKIVHLPGSATINDVMKIVFNNRSYGKKVIIEKQLIKQIEYQTFFL